MRVGWMLMKNAIIVLTENRKTACSLTKRPAGVFLFPINTIF